MNWPVLQDRNFYLKFTIVHQTLNLMLGHGEAVRQRAWCLVRLQGELFLVVLPTLFEKPLGNLLPAILTSVLGRSGGSAILKFCVLTVIRPIC